MKTLLIIAAAVACVIGCNSPGFFAAVQSNALSGTSWQLVKFQGDDGTTLVPDDGSKYTITFASNGRVSSRVDCNHGGSTWKTSGSNELHFGSWNMSRTKCAADSLYNRIVNDGANVRYYELKNGHLFLWGMEAGGFYELAPVKSQRRNSRTNRKE